MACKYPDGVLFKPDGVHEVLPCRYVEKEIHRNVTVVVGQCKNCGEVMITWFRQDDTEDEIIEQLEIDE